MTDENFITLTIREGMPGYSEQQLRANLRALVETWRSRTTSTYWCGICLERMADDLERVIGGEG